MWTAIKWTLVGIVVVVFGGLLSYTLPSHDVVRVQETYNRLTTISSSNAMFYASSDRTETGPEQRDIYFIRGVFPDEKVKVYRNEDTGWIWPPYFKLDSSNLQAEAANLASTRDAPQWVVITYYGWRIPFLSVYPNAVSLRAVDSPDVTVVPWFNIIFLTFLALCVLLARRMWMQFRLRTIAPMIDDVNDALEDVSESGEEAARRARGFFSRLIGR
ncbi:DUF1523 family protein [Phaeovulum vinaykumarii]|uniref:DUF1523 family protein n=1 Tax=Phaeovulum vinaykumarii TaxID=407234 RepID=A0A1N7K1X2_9RHOB|nr:DUF1523 family protein [Phaeovulum vinaykumarii]SIS55561.1 Protein of unknown function [Phaeovulum vinaykumarii]SOB92433.1 uncharacterized protein DUF1523 [Phaeovulum vinaykumarii]